jgi:hypothetical protein
MQGDCQRFGEGRCGEREVSRHRVALALVDQHVVREAALHVREAACASHEEHIATEIAATFPTGEATPAIAPGMDRHSLPGADTRHLGTDLEYLAGDLMAGNERLTDREIAVPSFEVVVQVGAADATRPDPNQHTLRGNRRRVVLLEPEILGLVDDTNAHWTNFPVADSGILIYHAAYGNRPCSFSTPLI